MQERELTVIPDDELDSVIISLYDHRKEHLQEFIKTSLKQLLKNDHPGDLVVLNILVDIFSDDELCRNRLLMEIRLHQQKIQGQSNDYRQL